MRLFAALVRWYGFSHRDLMDMPWPTLLAYAEAMAEQIHDEQAAAYVGGRSALWEEYRQHINEWRRRQPPPRGDGHGRSPSRD